jgi:hypothetical protein
VQAYPLFKSGAEIAPQVREWSQQPGGVLMITYNKLAALMLKVLSQASLKTSRNVLNLCYIPERVSPTMLSQNLAERG